MSILGGVSEERPPAFDRSLKRRFIENCFKLQPADSPSPRPRASERLYGAADMAPRHATIAASRVGPWAGRSTTTCGRSLP
jgi:hypothetical protein